MNTIAGFRLCTLDDRDLINKIDAHVDKMYKTKSIPSRHIPAKPNDDFDLLIGELLIRFGEKSGNYKFFTNQSLGIPFGEKP